MKLGFKIATAATGETLLLDAETGQPLGEVRFSPEWEGDPDFTTAELTFDPAVAASIAALGPYKLSWNYQANTSGQYLELVFVGLDVDQEQP